MNTVRLKLWVNPEDSFDRLQRVQEFSNRLKSKGFQIWLTLHYSDTWADPGNQLPPKQWENYSFSVLRTTVRSYTQQVMQAIQPDFIQIGNEINSGFLHPFGDRFANKSQFLDLLATGIQAVRDQNSETKIILHYAGYENADLFFNEVNGLDYDIIGLSYYPIWHGKSLARLQSTLEQLATRYEKEVIIAETAYPFTLGWNDWTNNIVGLPEQLLPNYPSTEQGQKNYIDAIVSLSKTVTRGIGFCYWGAELIAWKGTEGEDASPWENQALFDFNNQALPVLTSFDVE